MKSLEVCMKILVACEESQVVTNEFRKLGHEAYSCDIETCSGGHPEWHLQQDVSPLLNNNWDMIIAFPPCTHLAASGAAWFERKRKDGRQQQGIDFFMLFANAKCSRIAIESPVGIMSTVWRKPDQIIHPYQFGEPFSKKTCLWLKGLPNLTPTNIVGKGEQVKYSSGRSMPKWYADALKLPPKERARLRSKTFQGIANAMAEQWGKQMTIKEIVKECLKIKGFDGLAGEDCGCGIDDLMPCDNPSPQCRAGYKITCNNCSKLECDYRGDNILCIRPVYDA